MTETVTPAQLDNKWILAKLTGRHGEKADLARAMEVPMYVLSKVFSGERRVQPEEFGKVAKFFGCVLTGDERRIASFDQSVGQSVPQAEVAKASGANQARDLLVQKINGLTEGEAEILLAAVQGILARRETLACQTAPAATQ